LPIRPSPPPLIRRLFVCAGRRKQGIRDGQVEEPHGAQPIVQGAQERHQEAQAPPPDLHQGDGPQVPEEPEVLKEEQQQG